MGAYSELFLKVELKEDIDPVFEDQLQKLASGVWGPDDPRPDHPLFSCDRFRHVCRGGSAYHTTVPTKLFMASPYHNRVLFVNSSLKDYDDEFTKFLSWISPHVISEHIMGWIHHHDSKLLELIVETESGEGIATIIAPYEV